MTKLERLLDTLEGVGGPDDIAAYLTLQGCRRVAREKILPIGCPVALYLQMNGIENAVVGYSTASDGLGIPGYDLPTNVAAFVNRYDNREYPSLRPDEG